MPRVTGGTRQIYRRKKILNQAKGYRGRRKSLFRTAKDAVAKSLQYAYRDRRRRKREFRSLWIARLSAACRAEGISYSQFMCGVRRAHIGLNRKVLSNLAIEDQRAFRDIVRRASENL